MNVSAKAHENESLDGLLERRVVQFQRASEERRCLELPGTIETVERTEVGMKMSTNAGVNRRTLGGSRCGKDPREEIT